MKFFTCNKTEQPKYDNETCFLFFENKQESLQFIDDNYDEIISDDVGYGLIRVLRDNFGGWFYYDKDHYGNGIFRPVPTELVELIAK